eukprot:GHVL01044592.1.p1 GENE.GHVL01044592.1~~GHVL01044592.1.p1  ORF type:complete len:987 (-),score=238.43 GHVL01044592.1:143-3103(-)
MEKRLDQMLRELREYEEKTAALVEVSEEAKRVAIAEREKAQILKMKLDNAIKAKANYPEVTKALGWSRLNSDDKSEEENHWELERNSEASSIQQSTPSQQNNPRQQQHQQIKQPPPQNVKKQMPLKPLEDYLIEGVVRVRVLSVCGVANTDGKRLPDPFCSVLVPRHLKSDNMAAWDFGKPLQTNTVKGALSAVFDKTKSEKTWEVTWPQPSPTPPTVVISVFDADTFGKDFLGQVSADVAEWDGSYRLLKRYHKQLLSDITGQKKVKSPVKGSICFEIELSTQDSVDAKKGDHNYLPLKFDSEVDESVMDEHAGMMTVQVLSATNLKDADIGLMGKSDPYTKVVLPMCYRNNDLGPPWKFVSETWHTSVKSDELNPSWMESQDFWVHFPETPDQDMDAVQPLVFQVFDSDSTAGISMGDDFLGEAKIPLLETQGGKQYLLPLKSRLGKKDKVQGNLALELTFREVGTNPLEIVELDKIDVDSSDAVGELRIKVISASNVPPCDGGGALGWMKVRAKTSDPWVRVIVPPPEEKKKKQFVFDTKSISNTLNPTWDVTTHKSEKKFPVNYRNGLPTNEPIILELWDSDGPTNDFIGEAQISFPTVSGTTIHRAPIGESTRKQGKLKPVEGVCTITVEVQWVPQFEAAEALSKPVIVEEPDDLPPCIEGTFTLTVLRAEALRVADNFMEGSKSDPYVSVKVPITSDTFAPPWYTKTIKKNLNPEWNESQDFTINFPNKEAMVGKNILIEVFDQDKMSIGRSGDDFLGEKTIPLHTVIQTTKTKLHPLKLLTNKKKNKAEAKGILHLETNWAPAQTSADQRTRHIEEEVVEKKQKPQDPPKPPPAVSRMLEVVIERANGLRKGDSVFKGGKSDPYCLVTFVDSNDNPITDLASQHFRDEKVDRNLNPVWNKTLTWSVPPELQKKLRCIVDVLDYDKGCTVASDDNLGRVAYNVPAPAQEVEFSPGPQQLQKKNPKDKSPSGSVTVSFNWL